MKKNIFNKISVVQSLSDNDLHTGTKVKDDIDLYNFAYGRGLNIELVDANTKGEFIDIITGLTQKAQNEASFPLLHIEAHGSSDRGRVVGRTEGSI